MRATVIFIAFFICSWPVYSQSAKKYPINFPLFFTAYPIINPASSGTENGFMDLRLGDLGNTGPFKEIRTLYANGSFAIRKKSTRYKHVLGITGYNDKEGDPIQRTRFYGNYALHIPLGPETYLSSGISLGAANFSFRGSTGNSTGSDINYDGSLGLWLYGESYHAGISLNQMFNRKIMPIREQFILAPYLSATGSRKFKISERFYLEPHFIANFYNKDYYEADLVLLSYIANYLTAGISYRSQRSLVWIAGLHNILILKNKFQLFFSYSTPFMSKGNMNVNSYQLSLNYIFVKKEKNNKADVNDNFD